MRDTRLYFYSALVLILAGIYSIYNLWQNSLVEKHYIFTPKDLHALSISSVQKHGNDTKSIVADIVERLRADDKVAGFLSTDEEWVFNNAGGAMGAMYIIHASKSHGRQLSIDVFLILSSRSHGVLDYLWHSHRN